MLCFFVIVAPFITLHKVSTTDWWQVNTLQFQTLWVSMHLNFREKEEEKLCCERCHRCGNQVGTKSSLCVSLLYAIFCTQSTFVRMRLNATWTLRTEAIAVSKFQSSWLLTATCKANSFGDAINSYTYMSWLGTTWIQPMWTYTRKCGFIDHHLTWFCAFWVMNPATGVIFGGWGPMAMVKLGGSCEHVVWCVCGEGGGARMEGTRARLGLGFIIIFNEIKARVEWFTKY